jgi:hypothetical protein
VVESNNNLKSQISCCDEVLSQISSSIYTTLNSTSSTLEKDIKTVSMDSITDLRKCDSLLADCQSLLNLTEKEHSNLIELLSQSSQENTHSQSQSLKSTETLTTQALKVCLEELVSSSDDSINFASSHFTQHGHIQEGIHTFKYQPYIPSGTTPAKKVYDYPQRLTHSRQETDILGTYRLSLDPSYSDTASPENIPAIPSSPEIHEDLSDSMETSPTDPPRSSLPSNSLKTKPGITNPTKRDSKPLDTMTTYGQRLSNNNKGRTTKEILRRKPSVGGKAPVENPAVPGKANSSLNSKERSRLGDLTNQVKS